MHVIKKLTPLLLLFTPVVSNAALLYTSTFTDNGNLVTETRTYTDHTETWEWLDLTITNGFSYNSIAADLTDGVLGTQLTGHENIIADVTGLTPDQTGGWSIASDQDVVELFNSFFGLNLNEGQRHLYGANIDLIETFITYFGDTYHDSFDDNGTTLSDSNTNLPNVGYTYGFTSSTVNYNNYTYQKLALVMDGQYANHDNDNVNDYVTNYPYTGSTQANAVGTWLTRLQTTDDQAISISEPGTFALFTLALMGMFSGRYRPRLPR